MQRQASISRFFLLLVLAFGLHSQSAHAFSSADQSLPVSHFSITDKDQIPNVTLDPGTYLIRVLDHLSDRMVLQVENDKGKLLSTFLALPNKNIQRPDASGVISFGVGQKSDAIRGFSFENGTVAEFVYPKAQAVAIARDHSAKVPAVDPASEGMPAANKMSSNDMALITLWLLSPTTVGHESKPSGVLAQRYTAPSVVAQQEQQPAPEVAKLQETPVMVSQRQVAAPAPQVAQVTRTPVVTHLPHTAGSLPLFGLLGLISLILAAGLNWLKASEDVTSAT